MFREIYFTDVTDSFDEYMTIVNDDGQEVLITKELMKKLNEEAETWHWRPWLKTKTEVVGNIIQEVKRPSGDSVRTFPAGIFDGECSLYLLIIQFVLSMLLSMLFLLSKIISINC